MNRPIGLTSATLRRIGFDMGYSKYLSPREAVGGDSYDFVKRESASTNLTAAVGAGIQYTIDIDMLLTYAFHLTLQKQYETTLHLPYRCDFS